MRNALDYDVYVGSFAHIIVTHTFAVLVRVLPEKRTGPRMHHQIGIASKIFSCLSRQSINIEMISQGSSEISISVVIHSDQTDKAIKAIHTDFLSKRPKHNIDE